MIAFDMTDVNRCVQCRMLYIIQSPTNGMIVLACPYCAVASLSSKAAKTADELTKCRTDLATTKEALDRANALVRMKPPIRICKHGHSSYPQYEGDDCPHCHIAGLESKIEKTAEADRMASELNHAQYERFKARIKDLETQNNHLRTCAVDLKKKRDQARQERDKAREGCKKLKELMSPYSRIFIDSDLGVREHMSEAERSWADPIEKANRFYRELVDTLKKLTAAEKEIDTLKIINAQIKDFRDTRTEFLEKVLKEHSECVGESGVPKASLGMVLDKLSAAEKEIARLTVQNEALKTGYERAINQADVFKKLVKNSADVRSYFEKVNLTFELLDLRKQLKAVEGERDQYKAAVAVGPVNWQERYNEVVKERDESKRNYKLLFAAHLYNHISIPVDKVPILVEKSKYDDLKAERDEYKKQLEFLVVRTYRTVFNSAHGSDRLGHFDVSTIFSQGEIETFRKIVHEWWHKPGAEKQGDGK